MPIDSRIYLEQRGTQADIGGAFERGMRMGEMYKKGKQERDTKAAFANGMVTNEDGTQTLDRGRTMAELMKVNPEAGLQFDQETKAMNSQAEKARREKMAYDADLIGRVAGGIKDQGTYEQGLSALQQSGVDTSTMPRQYDPRLVNGYRMKAMSVAEQFAQENKQREMRLKEQELGMRNRENGSGGGAGKAPQGYRFKPDGSLEPIPGGPAAQAAGNRETKQKQDAGLVVQDIGRSLQLIDDNPSSAGTKDFGLMSYVPGSSAQSLDHLLESVKSNIGFNKLQAMREASPTGGALGSVSEKETAMLQATAGKLSSYMPEDQLKDNLKRLSNQYNDIVHGPGKGPPRYQLSFDEQGKPVQRSIVNQQTKVVDGVTYKKVQGGWEEIPMPAAR